MKKFLSLVLVLAVVMSLALVGSTSASAAGKYNKINLTMTVNGTDTQIDTKVGQKFAELVEEATDGAVLIDVFPNDQLKLEIGLLHHNAFNSPPDVRLVIVCRHHHGNDGAAAQFLGIGSFNARDVHRVAIEYLNRLVSQDFQFFLQSHIVIVLAKIHCANLVSSAADSRGKR